MNKPLNKPPKVGIENFDEQINFANFSLSPLKMAPLPAEVHKLQTYIDQQQKRFMSSAKELEKNLSRFKQELKRHFKVTEPMRYVFKIGSKRGLPKVTWYRIVIYGDIKQEIEYQEVSLNTVKRFKGAFSWEHPVYEHLTNELMKLENRVELFDDFSRKAKGMIKSKEKLFKKHR